MKSIIRKIKSADDSELSDLIQAIIARYASVHPDWEVVFLSLPKNNPEERRHCINAAAALLLRDA